MQQQKQSSITPTQQDETILVVPCKDLFATQPRWNGMRTTQLDELLTTIKTNQCYQPRSRMETDPTYKQIIPYVIFQHDNRYFLMQRKAKASEQRLKGKFTLGIGGHMRQEDMTSDNLFSWAEREFHEEVSYTGSLKMSMLGALNDDSNAVGQVHLGIVLLVKGDNDAICVKSELASGSLCTLDQIKERYDAMETWSQYVCNTLQTIPYLYALALCLSLHTAQAFDLMTDTPYVQSIESFSSQPNTQKKLKKNSIIKDALSLQTLCSKTISLNKLQTKQLAPLQKQEALKQTNDRFWLLKNRDPVLSADPEKLFPHSGPWDQPAKNAREMLMKSYVALRRSMPKDLPSICAVSTAISIIAPVTLALSMNLNKPIQTIFCVSSFILNLLICLQVIPKTDTYVANTDNWKT